LAVEFTALRDSHVDMKRYTVQMTNELQKQYDRLQKRIEAAYEEKLDSADPSQRSFYDNMSDKWRSEQVQILNSIEKHQYANRSYMDDGVRILELAKRALELYKKRSAPEKRRMLQLIFSNSTWKNGQLHPSYKKPFSLLAEFNTAYQSAKAASMSESGLNAIKLPGPDSR
jgi:site-specific DNA recombinase